MLVVPNLYETCFHRIDANLSVPLDQLSGSDHEDHAPFEYATKAQIPGEKLVFATLEMCAEISGTLDLEAFLSWSFEKPPRGPELWDLAAQPGQDWHFSLENWKESDPESIWNPLNVFLDKKVNFVLSASFTVDRDELPPESLVASMIGLRTKAGEELFLMSGAQFAVRGFPEDTISWYLKPGSYGKQVSGQLVRQCVEQFHWESISDAIHVVEARFNRVFRAQSSISSHVA